MTLVTNIHCGVCGTPLVENDAGMDPICPICSKQEVAEQEPHYNCPIDGTPMTKEVHGDCILDHCPTCKVFLIQSSELDELNKAWYEQGLRAALGSGV